MFVVKAMFADGKGKAPAIGWALLVGLIEVLRRSRNTPCCRLTPKRQ